MELGDRYFPAIVGHGKLQEAEDPVLRSKPEGWPWLVVPFVFPCPSYSGTL